MAQLLIVDDESPMRELLSLALADSSHEVREAASAREALALLRIQPADVVFLDVYMPGRDGIWLAGQIRQLYPLTAVVFVTGNSSIAPSRTLRKGVIAYLVKPFPWPALRDALAASLKWCAEERAGHSPAA